MVSCRRSLGESSLLLSLQRLVLIAGWWTSLVISCAAAVLLWYGCWCVAGGVSWIPGVSLVCPSSFGLDFQAGEYGDSGSRDPGRCFRHPW